MRWEHCPQVLDREDQRTTAHFNDGLVEKMGMTGKCLELTKMVAGEKEEVVDSAMIAVAAVDTATEEDMTEVAVLATIVEEEVVLTEAATVKEVLTDVAVVLTATAVVVALDSTVVIAEGLTVEVPGMVALIEADPLRLVNALVSN